MIVDKTRVIIGSDHAGYELKEHLKNKLIGRGLGVIDKGTYSSESTDYPDYAHSVARGLGQKEGELGVLICGSANGVSMAANKHEGIRAAIAWNEEIALLARTHNDANILSLPARFVTQDEAEKILFAFIEGGFEGGRHKRRVDKINC